MAQPQLLQIKLSRFDAQPWGFRLQGGVDFAAPLLVQKVNGGSLAEQAGLMPGDAVIKINDVDVYNLRHKDAQDIVVRSGNNFVITVQRGGSTWRPHVTPTGHLPQPNSPYLQTVTKTSLAHKQQDSQHIGCGYNNAAKPFGNGVDGNVKSIVNKQYNSPVGIYSDESIAETLSAQAEVLAGGVLGVNFKKNEKEYQAEKSEVLKFLREEESGQSTPAFNNHSYQEPQQHQHHQQQPPQQQQHYHQQQQQQQQQSATRHVSAPVNQPKPPSTGGLPTGQNICVECERLITGVFVRIKDRNLHVECFKCATCGTSLKNQGYYNFNNKLYCEIHAKLAALQNPPSGTEGYVPVPIKPNTKLSASTIASALNAHGYNNGVSNGSSTPAPEEENMNDLPLPPPPSPTQLQQYEIYNNYDNNNTQTNTQTITHNHINNDNNNQHTRTLSSLSSMSTGSNTTHSSTQSLSPIPYNYQQHNNTIMQQHQQQQQQQQDLYGNTHSPLHSRQASSSSSSLNYGCNASDNCGPVAMPIPPPPPPPLPEHCNEDPVYINTMKQQHNTNNRKLMSKQFENDTNTYNNSNNKTNVASNIAAPVTIPSTQKVYNKFLKEYSNKLLTQGNNNTNTLKHSDNNISHNNNNNNNNNNGNNTSNNILNYNNTTSYINNGSPKPFIASACTVIATPSPSPSSKQTQQQHNHYLQQQQQQQQQQQTNNNINNNNLPSVAAITATLNNQLKFDSCQVAPPTPQPLQPQPQSQSQPTATPSSSTTNISISNSTANDMASIMATGLTVSEQTSSTGSGSDKPFEYVTLTGNVIRSVIPPGKGNVSYKVNQGGYARPYGAPPAAAPKSPVSYPPQQQWNQPPPTQPKPAGGSAYATLPRSNVGQQESLVKPSMLSDTLPRKTNAKPKTNASYTAANASLQQTTDLASDDPTAMLNESIGKINMGNKMDNFMAEAGKVISNMLEARLANNNGNGNANGMPSPHSSSSLSLLSNSSSNLSRSPMVVRKRLDLDDFKDINPAEPAALKPVITVLPNVEQKPEVKLPIATAPKANVYATDLPANHPMGKVLELCDNKTKPVSPLATRSTKTELNTSLPPSETVIYRNNDRSNRRASHATDRRSYIETNAQTEQQPKDGPVFSISVKALGKPGGDPNKPMSPENEEVVSQLLKEGKKPICCQCNNEITSGPFITALGKIWCPEHFHCVNGNCRRPLQDIGFVEEKGDLYCEYCFEKYLAPTCSKCAGKIKGDCLNAIGKHFHPECFACGHCGKLFGNTPFFLEDGMPYCEADWNELFTTKCFACGFPVEAGDRWVEALNHNYHSQCFNCTYCKQNLEGQSFYNKGGRPFCKNHAR